MVTATRSIDEILALVLRRESVMHPRLRGLWLIQGVGALLLSLILTTAYFEVPLPISFDFLAPGRSPMPLMLLITLIVEGGFVVHRFARHDEPPYAQLAQGAALTLASAGALAAGAGVVLYFAWTSLFSGYFPDALWMTQAYPTLMLAGAGAVLAALPALGAGAIKPFVQAES